MLVYCSLCVCNLFITAGNRGRWPASVKLVTLPYLPYVYSLCTTALYVMHSFCVTNILHNIYISVRT